MELSWNVQLMDFECDRREMSTRFFSFQKKIKYICDDLPLIIKGKIVDLKKKRLLGKENSTYKRYFWIFTFLIFSFKINAQKADYINKLAYLELGVGVGVISRGHIANTNITKRPLIGYVEYGKFRNLLALNLSYSLNEAYDMSNFSYHPKYFSALLKPYFYSISVGKSNLELFGLLGMNYASTSLIDKGNTQVISYENKKETDQGVGYTLGMGTQMVINQLVLKARWVHIQSKSSYIAGGFGKSSFNTGSDQIQLSLGYRFKRKVERRIKNAKICPTYK